MNVTLHDAYAADYDAQVQACDCYIADLLFGLCFEFTRPGQRLLDAGIGSGLSSQLFAKAGLTVSGMDFSPAMLEICRAKGSAAELTQHDLERIPWPYPLKTSRSGVEHSSSRRKDLSSRARRGRSRTASLSGPRPGRSRSGRGRSAAPDPPQLACPSTSPD